jgi:signal transduction histidine kinase
MKNILIIKKYQKIYIKYIKKQYKGEVMDINILIVDDKEENLMVLEDILDDLAMQNINIISALDANQALQIALETKIDLIISDIQMPNINGFEMAKILKDIKKTKDIPIIFLTAAFKAEEFIDKGYDVGAIDYFLKPIERYAFLNKINMYVQLFQKEKNLQKQLEIIQQQQETLIEQSRFASMGEMIANISHQWKQPLSALSYMIQILQFKPIENKKQSDELLEKALPQIDYLSNTIEDFRTFFIEEKENHIFNIEDGIKNALTIVGKTLETNQINLSTDAKDNFILNGKQNTFAQVIINILNNAKDALVSNRIENKIINIKYGTNELGVNYITIEDNANGIPSDILPKIFEPYFTTKFQNQGTGIGLYMSKMIIENQMGGKLEATNSIIGAIFKIEFKG